MLGGHVRFKCVWNERIRSCHGFVQRYVRRPVVREAMRASRRRCAKEELRVGENVALAASSTGGTGGPRAMCGPTPWDRLHHAVYVIRRLMPAHTASTQPPPPPLIQPLLNYHWQYPNPAEDAR